MVAHLGRFGGSSLGKWDSSLGWIVVDCSWGDVVYHRRDAVAHWGAAVAHEKRAVAH